MKGDGHMHSRWTREDGVKEQIKRAEEEADRAEKMGNTGLAKTIRRHADILRRRGNKN